MRFTECSRQAFISQTPESKNIFEQYSKVIKARTQPSVACRMRLARWHMRQCVCMAHDYMYDHASTYARSRAHVWDVPLCSVFCCCLYGLIRSLPHSCSTLRGSVLLSLFGNGFLVQTYMPPWFSKCFVGFERRSWITVTIVVQGRWRVDV